MSNQAPQLLLDILPAPAPTLDNFIAGGNGEALAALRGIGPGRAIYLWGPAGSGRSHLLAAAVRAHPGAVLCGAATPAREFVALAEGGVPLVAIDDVGRLDERQQAAVFGIYNRWRESAAAEQRGFALVVAGDSAPLRMPLREDLRTRLGWDLVFRLDLLSDADKLAALHAHAAARSLDVTPELLEWLLTRHARDMRQLTALLDALDRYSLATKRPITLPLLKTMLAAQPRPPAD
ncbi:DnaA regulatory inactivator Hda [Verticiella sediminum]|uniref:DnaA regulatory inactivator Hda n=2 Tax=Verticiella sediminum TaxID=1247510 RepID=A0A556AQB9_9BURK|nr:DnaA regulatory inactivator Hda [Verticiella sediminum]